MRYNNLTIQKKIIDIEAKRAKVMREWESIAQHNPNPSFLQRGKMKRLFKEAVTLSGEIESWKARLKSR
jgi:hypothetical protein